MEFLRHGNPVLMGSVSLSHVRRIGEGVGSSLFPTHSLHRPSTFYVPREVYRRTKDLCVEWS